MESTHVQRAVRNEHGEATQDAGERDHQDRNDQRAKRTQNRHEKVSTVDQTGVTKEMAGEKLVGQASARGVSMSRAQITATAMARRRCKMRTRRKYTQKISEASRGRNTEVATSQDTDEPVQKDTIHRTSQDANTQIYGEDDKSSRVVFLDQDEIDRENQEADDAEVDDLNESDEFGMYLVQLYSTLEDTEWEERPELQADIVLVAGLGGHVKETWRAPDGTLWPRQLLPDHVDNIRVLSFNYNNTLKGSASQAGIEEHAEDLLVALFNAKEDEDAKLRPIVFVGHSLGGLIIKQALCLAERRFDGKYKSLWEATRGVMFFSTPHYGMDKTLWRNFVRYVLQHDAPIPGAVPTQGMLVEIWHSASGLERISESFEPLQQYLCFQTFVETRPMEGIGEPFVNMTYGRLRTPTEHHQTIEGDHLGICKFGKDDDAPFLPVWGGIEQLINQTPKSIDRIGRHGKKALYQLCSDEFHSQPLSRKPTPDTCNWVQDRPEFKDWQSDAAGTQHLWISGPPACGKSFLAKHIIHEFGQGTSRDVIHCFITNCIPSHGGLSAVLRSTMHQALRLDPEIINEFVPREPQSHGEERDQVWSDDKLSSLWPHVMAKVAAQHPMTAVIDGFDELKEDDREDFFDCLEQFEQNTSKPENLKLLLLSRQIQAVNPEESGTRFGRYDMKLEDTGADISKTVQQDLDRIFPDKTLQPQICDKIREISDGSYLSASLIAGDLSRNRQIHSKDTILQDMTGLYSDPDSPKDLTGVYNCIINRVSKPRNIGALLSQALLWAAFQKEALKPDEFNIAQAVGRAMEKNPTGEVTGEELEGFLDDNIAMTLDVHCGHLVKFQDGRLELVHDSLMTYLIAHYGGEESPNANLASICVTYLAMPHFSNSGNKPKAEKMNLWESKIRRRVDKHKFARYASLYWHDHIRDAGSSWPSLVAEQVLKGQELLEDQQTGFATCWTEIWWYFTMWPARNFPQDPPVDRTIPPLTPNTPVPPEIPTHQTPDQVETDQPSAIVATPEHQEETGPISAEQSTGPILASAIETPTGISGDGRESSSDLGFDLSKTETHKMGTPRGRSPDTRHSVAGGTPPISSSLNKPKTEFHPQQPASQVASTNTKPESPASPTPPLNKEPPQQTEDTNSQPIPMEPAKPSPSSGEQTVTTPKGKELLLLPDEASKDKSPVVPGPSTEPQVRKPVKEPAKVEPPPPKKSRFFGWGRVKEAAKILIRGESS